MLNFLENDSKKIRFLKMFRNPEKTFIHVVDYREIFGNVYVEHSLDGINIPDIPDFNIWVEIPENISLAETILRRSNPDILRGDLMHINGWEYHNDGVLIYDGHHFIPLSTEIDAYGSLPRGFTIEDFPIDYWHYDHNIIPEGDVCQGIDHNGIIWIPNHLISKPFNGFFGEDDNCPDFYYVEFVTRGKTVLLCFVPQNQFIDYETIPSLIPFDFYRDAPNELVLKYGEENIYYATGEGFDHP